MSAEEENLEDAVPEEEGQPEGEEEEQQPGSPEAEEDAGTGAAGLIEGEADEDDEEAEFQDSSEVRRLAAGAAGR
jgi:transcription elongation factor SPT6